MKDSQGPSICLHDPGFGVDATVQTDLSTMYQVWLGKLPLRSAIKNGHLEIHGSSAIVRRLPATLQLSPIAGVVTTAMQSH